MPRTQGLSLQQLVDPSSPRRGRMANVTYLSDASTWHVLYCTALYCIAVLNVGSTVVNDTGTAPGMRDDTNERQQREATGHRHRYDSAIRARSATR